MAVEVGTVGHPEEEEASATPTRRASATEDPHADSPTKFLSPFIGAFLVPSYCVFKCRQSALGLQKDHFQARTRQHLQGNKRH